MEKSRILEMTFADVYPLYIQKVQKKGRTKDEVDEIIFWLTGYDEQTLEQQIVQQTNLKTFFEHSPRINPNISLVKGVICGCRIEEIQDGTLRKIRCLDKLIDELAKGKPMEKILRK